MLCDACRLTRPRHHSYVDWLKRQYEQRLQEGGSLKRTDLQAGTNESHDPRVSRAPPPAAAAAAGATAAPRQAQQPPGAAAAPPPAAAAPSRQPQQSPAAGAASRQPPTLQQTIEARKKQEEADRRRQHEQARRNTPANPKQVAANGMHAIIPGNSHLSSINPLSLYLDIV